MASPGGLHELLSFGWLEKITNRVHARLVVDYFQLWRGCLHRRGAQYCWVHEPHARSGPQEEQVDLTSGLFTFVALDENHRPRPLPDA